ncbi:PTS sugar transporter subunit IIA [Dolosigranulum pigrum]|uniref:PTS sugar transporter subunit IIA n=1 Tax=Dolosigranulum pigrum TaxID=29394 RepID=UPI000DBFE6A3|nr:PTS sugar transporter subunit IIA [Dolosigranulum pigrum]RAN54083.1 hypothetical protein B8A31_02065 [Dolosigranulum pigrum]RAN56090.1 hypothetical protein B8A33_07590 [Dolosigranulum pigrum]
MVGVLISTHGLLANELKNTVDMLIGKTDISTLTFENNKSLDIFSDEMGEKIENLREKNSKLIILTDLTGGTPYKIAATKISEDKDTIKLLSGVNIPMLLETMISKEIIEDFDSLVEKLLKSGRKGVDLWKIEALIERTENVENGI